MLAGLHTRGISLVVGAVALRWALVLSGLGPYLQWRVNVSTPANSLPSVRECLLLEQLGVSPWVGSQCRTAPLMLRLQAWTAHQQHLYIVPNTLLDVMSGLMLRQVAAKQLTRMHEALHISPDTVMGVFLLNPLTIATSIAGTTSSAYLCCCIAVLCLAYHGRWLATAVLLALASYQDLQAALLLVPAVMLLAKGPESQTLTALTDMSHPQQGSSQTHSNNSPAKPDKKRQKSPQSARIWKQAEAERAPTSHSGLAGAVIGQGCLVTALLLLLWYMSDWVVQGLKPSAACMPHIMEWLQPMLPSTWADRQHSGGGSQVQSCWAHTVYRLHILVEDQTPNIGQFWYLFTEMFSPYLALFRFVAHSLAVVLVVPLALRFPDRPVFLFTLQCIISCMFKTYPSVADHALYMALLPLLQEQLVLLQQGLMMVTSFLLLAVLEGSMWHQWINIESANSNFFYSITLLIGAWQTLLVVMLCMLTVRAEHLRKACNL